MGTDSKCKPEFSILSRRFKLHIYFLKQTDYPTTPSNVSSIATYYTNTYYTNSPTEVSSQETWGSHSSESEDKLEPDAKIAVRVPKVPFAHVSFFFVLWHPYLPD